MESCLTLVRSYYAAQEETIQDFVKEHPTQDKNRLMSKIIAQMMIRCNQAIQEDQIVELLKHKLDPTGFDYSRGDWSELILLDWDSLRFTPSSLEEATPGEGMQPVEMTPQEIQMSNEVEDYSDELKRESDDEMRDSMARTQVAFMDVTKMSATVQAIVLIVVLGLFGGIGYFFYIQLFAEIEDPYEARRAEIRAKANAKKFK